MTKEVSQVPSPFPPCSHHSAVPWPILEVSLHNSGAQSLSLSCATTFPLGLPKTDQSAAEQSQQHSQAGFGVCGAGHTPRPHHPVCPIKDSSTLLGHPRTSLVEGTHLSVLISTSPPHSLEQVATVPREGLGGSYLQGCRVSKGLQGLQGLSSVGLWLLGEKLQGKTCRRGVSG